MGEGVTASKEAPLTRHDSRHLPRSPLPRGGEGAISGTSPVLAITVRRHQTCAHSSSRDTNLCYSRVRFKPISAFSMLARQLASFLATELHTIEPSRTRPADIQERFERLRGYRMLPTGRTKNVTHLSHAEIAAGILCIGATRPGYAGSIANMLAKLQPVGGAQSSFRQGATLSLAIQELFQSEAALESFVELRISESEVSTNSHGRASITFREKDATITAHYVSPMASTLLRSGANETFDPRNAVTTVVAEKVFYPRFFRRLYRTLQSEAAFPRRHLPVPIEDEGEEVQKEERARRLGLTPISHFLNIGVDNQVAWPHTETVVEFEGHHLILMPRTAKEIASVHIDLSRSRISDEEAITLINRFLSLLAWCDDNFAVQQDGWSGNSVPAPIPKQNLAITTTYNWLFDRKLPATSRARRALAIYREGRNAEQNHLVSFAVLSYYKIVELKYRGKSEARTWFRDNFGELERDPKWADDVPKFLEACGTEKPSDYLYRACRVAVAHANKPYSTDPDDIHELRRLHVAARVLRALARQFISRELGVSDCAFDGS
jgi:hypothetical protein